MHYRSVFSLLKNNMLHFITVNTTFTIHETYFYYYGQL